MPFFRRLLTHDVMTPSRRSVRKTNLPQSNIKSGTLLAMKNRTFENSL